MSEDAELITLPPAASHALVAFARRIGQDPQALAAEAIERFIAEEAPFAEDVLRALANASAGRTVPFDDAVRDFEEVIERASRKRA